MYCYEINFIVTSKSRALEKPLIVMDQLWHLVRVVDRYQDVQSSQEISSTCIDLQRPLG